MKQWSKKEAFIAVIIVVLLFLITPLADTIPPQPPTKSTDEAVRTEVLEDYGKLPISFIQNDGQLDDRVEYYTQAAEQTLYFTNDGIVFNFVIYQDDEEQDLTGSQAESLVFNINFPGSNEEPTIEAIDKDEAIVNYLIGDDPDDWYTNIPTYKQLEYGKIYPGIDHRLYGKGEALEYEFVIEPGADIAEIVIEYSGTDSLAIEDAELMVNTPLGEMQQTQPFIYQEIGGETVAIDGGFRLVNNSNYGFAAATYDANYPLIMDPSLA